MKVKHMGEVLEVLAVKKSKDQPKRIRDFDRTLMAWYHAIGRHLQLKAEDLIRAYPTFLIRIGGYTLVVQGGGVKHTKSFSLDVFNSRGVVVDSAIYQDGKPGEKFPKKWPHGTRVVDSRQAMRFIPRNRRHPPLIPPQ